MEIDINEFKGRLEKEKARGNQNAANHINREIRLAEGMKASLMDEMNESTEEFLTTTAAKLDTYVFQLQELEKELTPFSRLPLDQQTALKDEKVREKMADNIKLLKKLNPEDNPESEN